jgi:hypothetical protein
MGDDDAFYQDLIRKIRACEISTEELWNMNFFDLESFLKEHNGELNEDVYPERNENGFFLHSAEAPPNSLGARNAFLLPEEQSTLGHCEQLQVSVARFCIFYGREIAATKHIRALAVLEWMLAHNVNILSKYKFGMNLMHVAANSSNYPAVERLLQIEDEDVKHELLHSTDCYRLVPWHLVNDVRYARKLLPNSILMHTLLTGQEYPQSELKMRYEPERKPKIWEVPVYMPPPLSELGEEDIIDLYWFTPSAFANILLWVNPEWRVERISQIVSQLMGSCGFDMLVDQNDDQNHQKVFENMKKIVDISQGLTNNADKAKSCIKILKDAFECDNEDEDYGYGFILVICIGRMDIGCFKFLQKIAKIIYSADDLQKLYLTTEHEMTLLEVSIQTRRPDIVQLILGLDIPMECNLEPGQHAVTGPRWTIISKLLIRGATEVLKIICNKCLEVQEEHLARGEPLPEALKPTYKSNGQTYWELLDDETSHTAFDHQKKYLLNNWSWNEDELDDLEAQNKNNAVTRRGMHKILNDWKKKFDLNNTAHGI